MVEDKLDFAAFDEVAYLVTGVASGVAYTASPVDSSASPSSLAAVVDPQV